MDRGQLELVAPYVAPSRSNEQWIVDLWSEMLSVSPVGLDDDFFELGGDSLAAENFATSFKEHFKFELKPGQIARWNTPRKLAALLGDVQAEAVFPGNITAINHGESREPLFVIHGRAGKTILRTRFIAGLHGDQPLYLYQAQGYDGKAEPLTRVEDIAASYLDAMLEISPDGPWHIMSFCAGGWIAIEMACQMRERGLEPSSVTLVDVSLGLANLKLDEWIKWRRAYARYSYLPVSPSAFVDAGLAASSLVRKVWPASGGKKHGGRGLTEKELAERFRRRIDQKYDRMIAELKAKEAAEDDDPERWVRHYASDSTRRTESVLRVAFLAYEPKLCSFPFTLIACEDRSEFMDQPDHPLRKLLPNCRVIVSGLTHSDAVSSNETARIVQKLVDDASATARPVA